MFTRILVPLDGSKLAERALPHAEQFARIFDANIFLLQILEPTSYHENPKSIDPLAWQIRKAEADVYMQEITAQTRENLKGISPGTVETKSRVEYAIREGKTAENIVDFAHSEGIDLLVISSHGSGGLSRWNLSSVTQKVINLIYLPVMIVRAYHHPETADTRIRYRRILLPVDSSRRAECALAAGIAVARGEPMAQPEPSLSTLSSDPNYSSSPFQTKITLAEVIRPPEIPIPEPHLQEISQLTNQLIDVSRQAAEFYLKEIEARIPVNCQTFVIESNSVNSAIQEMANQEEDIDLVVLCAHGYTGQSTWPYGSVARNYIEYGTKPVLVIQDVQRSQVRPTAAEIAAEKSGRR